MKNSTTYKSLQRGFTLIEMMLVIAVIAIVSLWFMSTRGNSTDAAQASMYESIAKELANGIGYINANLGNGLDTSSANPIAASGSNMLDVLVHGVSKVDDKFEEQFKQLGMRPVSGELTPEGNGYRVRSSSVRFVPCDTAWLGRKVCVEFTNVAHPVIASIFSKRGLDAATDPGDDNVKQVGTGEFKTITFSLIP